MMYMLSLFILLCKLLCHDCETDGAYEEEEEEHVDDDAASSIYTDREVEEENEDCSESDEIAFPEEDEEDVEEESDSEDQDVESEDHEHREVWLYKMTVTLSCPSGVTCMYNLLRAQSMLYTFLELYLHGMKSILKL